MKKRGTSIQIEVPFFIPEAKYKTSYKVRLADANEQAKLKIPSLFEMLQEVATEHANKLGVDFSALSPKGLGWALCNEFANSDTFEEPLERPKIITTSVECNVRNNDIDLNGHVNNSIYVVWAMHGFLRGSRFS